MLLPDPLQDQAWQMIEVKSSTSLKTYYLDDAAIQPYIANQAGTLISQIEVAVIDSTFVYSGNDKYVSFLLEHDVTATVNQRVSAVKEWVSAAHVIANQATAPFYSTGAQCCEPYKCGFIHYCQSQQPQTPYPVEWLPAFDPKKWPQ